MAMMFTIEDLPASVYYAFDFYLTNLIVCRIRLDSCRVSQRDPVYFIVNRNYFVTARRVSYSAVGWVGRRVSCSYKTCAAYPQVEEDTNITL